MEEWDENDPEVIIEENEGEGKDIEEEFNEKGDIESLINCLKTKNFTIYGSKTCPYCLDLVNLFGGYEKVAPIYVECSDQKEICQEKDIALVPTILINDEVYEGEKTLQAFASRTQCFFD